MSKGTSNGLPAWPDVPDFPADAFTGTARYYARYRVPYPQALVDDLRRRAGVTGIGRLLDLGCGPGRVALALSPYFREAWAVDLEPEMIEVGQEEAVQCGTTNVRWTVCRAEEIEVAPESLELITMGESFHRVNRPLIAKRALEWLTPGRCLVIMGCSVFKGKEGWQTLVTKSIAKVLGEGAGAERKTTTQRRRTDAEVLQAAGFEAVENHRFPTPHVWTVESIIGQLYSTSWASKRVLGNRAEAFETDLRRALLTYDPRDQYSETLDFFYDLAKRPPPIASW